MKISLYLFLLTVATGCSRDQDAAHPDHPIGLAGAALRDTAFTWQTRETDHFRIHYQTNSYAANHIAQFVKDAEQARANGLQVLDVSHFGPRIDLFHLKPRDQMKHLTEYPVRGWTDPDARTVLLVRSSDSNQGERHEIAHVLSHNLWGHSRDWLTTNEARQRLRSCRACAIATRMSLCQRIVKRRTIQVCKAIASPQRRSARRVEAFDGTGNRKTQRGLVHQ